MLVGYFVM